MTTHTSLSKARIRVCRQIMLEGNPLLVKLYKQVLRKNEWGRYYNRATFRKDLFAAIDRGDCELHGVPIPQKYLKPINAVRAIQNEMFLGFSRLLGKLAQKWAARATMKYPEAEDFYTEAGIKLIDVIYGYCDPAIKFITYATRAINNRLLHVFNEANPLSPLTNKDRKLRERMDRVAQQHNGPMNHEILMEDMNLSPKHRRDLERSFFTVIFATDMNLDHNVDSGDEDDYTALGKPICDNTVTEVNDVSRLLTQLQLTPFEMALVHAAMHGEGKRGWQRQVCDNFNYGRTAAGVALKRLRSKLERRFSGQISVRKRKTA